MREITNARELEHYTLQRGDSVKLNDMWYRVRADGFLATQNGNNESIFNELGFTSERDKYKLAQEAYGYNVQSGLWPSAHYKDYEALTRLVRKLYELIGVENRHTQRSHFLSIIIDRHKTKPFTIVSVMTGGTKTDVAFKHDEGRYWFVECEEAVKHRNTLECILKTLDYENHN